MKELIVRAKAAFLTITVVMSAAGCIPLVVGAAAGVGGYAWVQGELANDVSVSNEKLHRAVIRAVRDLKLAVYEDKSDRLSSKVFAKFADGTDVHINTVAKTERVATVKIRVGLLGDKEKSEMIFAAIQKRL
ncbi:MAG: DUF3568 family protein [Candidatus Omnitrophica bacterium]|nr:DUF3568 family protein [Candidatus Omnitrophota bacterium]